MSHSASKIAIVLALVVALGAAWWFFLGGGGTQAIQPTVMGLLQKGDVKGAAALYQEILNSPTSTPQTLSYATRGNVSLYSVTNTYTTSDIVESIRRLKSLTANQSLSAEDRAGNINVLARLYRQSMLDHSIANEIFSDEPYRSLQVASSSINSLQNLYGLSIRTYPTARAEMAMASLYADRLLTDNARTASNRDALLEKGEQYLKQAEALSAQELAKGGQGYTLLPDYPSYLIDRAYAIGGFAVIAGAPYTTSYKDAYEELIAFLKDADQAVFKTYLGGTYWHYAVFLSAMGEPDQAVKAALDASADAYTPPSLEFKDFVKTYRGNPGLLKVNYAARMLFDIAPLSPKFSALLKSIR